MKMRHDRGGFTLIELMVTIVLIGMVLTLAGSIMKFSFTAEKKTVDEYTLQSEVRLASGVLNKAIRNATVTFTIPQSLFDGTKKEGWNYFGLEDNNKIVQYTYTGKTGEVVNHTRKVLVEASNNVLYNLYFAKNIPLSGQADTKLIEFNLECYINGNEAKKIAVQSELKALNSIVVEDVGSASNPARAIAYRSDSTPVPTVDSKEVNVAVAIALDKSGSMNDTISTNKTKMSVLKVQANLLLDTLAKSKNIDVCIIPYDYSANPLDAHGDVNLNGTYELINAKLNNTALKATVSGMTPNGSTNTGDALRRAYFALLDYKNKTENKNKVIVYYIILLTDGNPTKYSVEQIDHNSVSFLKAGGAANLSGDGSNVTPQTLGYVEDVGQVLVVKGQIPGINTSVIGFTKNSTEVNRVKEIAETYCGGTYYPATSEVDLTKAFETISQLILSETWHIYGPY